MPATGKIPKRNKLDLIYAIGSLRTVSSLLAIPPGLTVDEVHDIIERSHRFDRSTILTAMVAKVDDRSGAELCGVDRLQLDPGLAKADCSAQDVLMALMRIGTEKLREIHEFPAALQAELFTALKSGSCTLRALAILDQMQGEIVERCARSRHLPAGAGDPPGKRGCAAEPVWQPRLPPPDDRPPEPEGGGLQAHLCRPGPVFRPADDSYTRW